MRHETRRLILLLLPAGIVFAAFFLLPMARLFFIGGSGKTGWAAYAAILTDSLYLDSLLSTLAVAAATTAATLVISGISGVFLQRHKFPGNALLVSMLTFPLAFPGVVIGFMIIMLAGRQGLIGQISEANSTTRLGGKTLKSRPIKKAGFFTDLLAWMPYKPRSYVLYFKEGTTDLTEESLPILEALRAAVNTSSEVQVTGHTDRVGDDATNDALSLERAREVRAALVKYGLPVENSRVTGRGEREPRVPTDDNVAEAANRRAEVILR